MVNAYLKVFSSPKTKTLPFKYSAEATQRLSGNLIKKGGENVRSRSSNFSLSLSNMSSTNKKWR